MTPTAEQMACINAAKSSQANLMFSALAGCAKTSTIEMVGRALSGTPILYLVFNKRNAVEAEKRLPGHIQVRTFNGIGHRVWAAALGRKQVRVATDKVYRLLQAEKPAARADVEEYYESFSEVLKAVKTAKLTGYVPKDAPNGHTLIDRGAFFASLDEALPQAAQDRVDRVLRASVKAAYEGEVDFDDQIYMPTLFGGIWPSFPLVMVDEAQDLSPLNHAMLSKLVKKRIIAVGDPFQSIYGFRGAVSNGMEVLRGRYGMEELPLSISFRCPQAIVQRAWNRVPHMRWADNAIHGEITIHDRWTSSTISDNAAIVCRNNAPLFKLALSLLRHRRGIKLLGADIGPGLIKVMKKLGPESMPQTETLRAINIWQASEDAKRKRATTADRAECLRVFALEGQTLGQAIAYAEHLFKAEGPIQLMSGHKSKGLEFDTVFHLDPWRIPSEYAFTPEEQEQELNIGYVILTRARRSYNEISMENYHE